MSEKTYKNCQSCGIPFFKDPEHGGSEKDGSKSTKFCSYCYTNGAFNGGDLTLMEFAEYSKNMMLEGGHNKFFSWLFSRPFMIGHLERWKQKK